MTRYDDLVRLAADVAQEAGVLVESMRREGVEVADTKSSPVDVVTAADRASEELIRMRILGERPDDGFLGEEGHAVAGSSGVRWVVDPIDGTVNYLYGIPAYAVSVAAEVDGRSVVGAVFNPASGELYVAEAGGGATLDGVPLRVRDTATLAQALVATGFNYDAGLRARQGGAVARLLPEVRDIRRVGACSLDLCGVAAGRYDAYVEEGIHAWDHAAGGLIAREAGARVVVDTGPSGRERVLCSASGLFDGLRSLVAGVGL